MTGGISDVGIEAGRMSRLVDAAEGAVAVAATAGHRVKPGLKFMGEVVEEICRVPSLCTTGGNTHA